LKCLPTISEPYNSSEEGSEIMENCSGDYLLEKVENYKSLSINTNLKCVF
ncbi:9594_t:CDS:1, partial [Racocetra fulgida]